MDTTSKKNAPSASAHADTGRRPSLCRRTKASQPATPWCKSTANSQEGIEPLSAACLISSY